MVYGRKHTKQAFLVTHTHIHTIEASPTLTMTTAPTRRIMVYVYHLPRVCRTLIPEICIRPEMLCVFWYIDMLTCVIYICIQLNSQDDWSYSCLP